MKNYYQSGKPAISRRVYRVESINAEKGISSSLRVSQDMKNYVVCLCLPTKTIKTTFLDEQSALKEMKRVRELYKPLR